MWQCCRLALEELYQKPNQFVIHCVRDKKKIYRSCEHTAITEYTWKVDSATHCRPLAGLPIRNPYNNSKGFFYTRIYGVAAMGWSGNQSESHRRSTGTLFSSKRFRDGKWFFRVECLSHFEWLQHDNIVLYTKKIYTRCNFNVCLKSITSLYEPPCTALNRVLNKGGVHDLNCYMLHSICAGNQS